MNNIKYVLIDQPDLNLCFNTERKLIRLHFQDSGGILISLLVFNTITNAISHAKYRTNTYLFSFEEIKPFNHYYFRDDWFPVVDIYSPDEVAKLYETYSLLI